MVHHVTLLPHGPSVSPSPWWTMREEGDMVDHEGGVREEGDKVDHKGGVREEGDMVDHEGGG